MVHLVIVKTTNKARVGLTYRPRSYNSKTKASKKSYFRSLKEAVQDYTRYNDQICIVTHLPDRKVVKSTKVTRAMLEEYVSRSGPASKKITRFFKELVGLDDLKGSETRLLAKILLKTDSVELMKAGISSETFKGRVSGLNKIVRHLENLSKKGLKDAFLKRVQEHKGSEEELMSFVQFSDIACSALRPKSHSKADRNLEKYNRLLKPTGVTISMLKDFAEGTDISHKNAIAELLSNLAGEDCNNLNIDQLKELSKLLIERRATQNTSVLLINKIASLRKTGEATKVQYDEELFHLIRSASEAIIGKDGKINIEATKEILKQIKFWDDRHHEHGLRILDLLINSPKFRKSIEKIKKPGDMEGTGTVKSYIRTMLCMRSDQEITSVDAKRAILGAVLSDLRQGNEGSCFGTAISIAAHDCIPQLMIKDLSSMVEKGYFTRKRKEDGKEKVERFYMGANESIIKEASENNMSPRDAFDMIRTDYPEYSEIFSSANLDKGFKGYFPTSRFMMAPEITIREIIDQTLKMHYDLSDEDFKAEEELKTLNQQIKDLSVEASVNNDSNLDHKVQELIEEYDTKAKQLGDKRFKLEKHHKDLSKLREIAYAEILGISLLSKGWDYAIMSAELRGIEGEHQTFFKKVPKPMKEMFRDTFFNKDKGDIFLQEIGKVSKEMSVSLNELNQEQVNQVQGLLNDTVNKTQSIMEERLTIKTVKNEEGSGLGHYLMYAVGEEDVKRFKVLSNEREYSEVMVSCMMEAFNSVIELNRDELDEKTKSYIMNFKGILGDELASKKFRESSLSFLANTKQVRAEAGPWGSFMSTDRISSLYFGGKNTDYHTIDQGYWSLRQYSPDPKTVGYLSLFSVISTTSLALAGIISPSSHTYAVAATLIAAALDTLSESQLAKKKYDKKNNRMNVLANFIKYSRKIYKEVKNRDEWIKYPVGIKGHACNLLPFNESIRKIVESDEDIDAYLTKMMESPDLKTIAVMDANYSNSCYLGFEIGGGDIRIVKLDAKYDNTGEPTKWDDDFGDVTIDDGIHKVIDETISKYRD